ncbi:hypothetical protein glysoja_044835 [Glycine soja]|uniref:Uncharacterized protein n=1 Tax=Glycine soja TaxID=3848 RepID=A0A0B2PLS4_GLYSO|nr:hypothetical protein JHK87_055262 [Glycine soja]KHN10301.1 hypothetical protein glysoja_044835 [Glycine soja]
MSSCIHVVPSTSDVWQELQEEHTIIELHARLGNRCSCRRQSFVHRHQLYGLYGGGFLKSILSSGRQNMNILQLSLE